MISRKAFPRVLPATATVVLACALAGCSGGSGQGGSGGTGLDAALANVASTPATRAQVAYDDTAALVKLSGTSPGTTKGFAVLRGWGASSLMDLAVRLSGDTGIDVFNEDYFQMYLNSDLPALPSCARLPTAAQSHVIGCP